jgi:antitoxin (DNA-binding transcriptional repressor) of toxin-antitoxin stability system
MKRVTRLFGCADGSVERNLTRVRTVARLVPATGPHALKGSLTGVAMTAAEDEDLFTTGVAWDLP